jgi:hypothetical protein
MSGIASNTRFRSGRCGVGIRVAPGSFPLGSASPISNWRLHIQPAGGAFGPTSVNINYAGNAFSNTPELTAASFTRLQGLDSADPFTVNFNAIVASPDASASFIFFNVLN